MTHAFTGRRRPPGDKRHNLLADIGFDVGSGLLFGLTADFSDQDDGVGLVVLFKHLQQIHVSRTNDGITANSDTGRLSQAMFCEIIYDLIGECATT